MSETAKERKYLALLICIWEVLGSISEKGHWISCLSLWWFFPVLLGQMAVSQFMPQHCHFTYL